MTDKTCLSDSRRRKYIALLKKDRLQHANFLLATFYTNYTALNLGIVRRRGKVRKNFRNAEDAVTLRHFSIRRYPRSEFPRSNEIHKTMRRVRRNRRNYEAS